MGEDVKEVPVLTEEEKVIKDDVLEDLPEYELPAEDKEALAKDTTGIDTDLPEKPKDDEDLKPVSPFIAADSVKQGETKEYKMPNNEVVLPFKYEYKPMTDIQRSKYSEKVRKCKEINQIRETAYAALKHHVLSTTIEGFDPSLGIHWAKLRPGDIIEEILDAVAGQVKLSEQDLGNLLTG